MSDWSLVYDDFNPKEEKLREALCTLGNGYFATRGAAAENGADEVHYPGTYLAGGYNRLKTEIAGRVIESEDLVNLPNWLPLKFRIAGGPWFDPLEVELLSYRQELDLKQGILNRKIRFRDGHGRVTQVRNRRLVHMGNHHLCALETKLLAENWSGYVEFEATLDGSVVNGGVARYQTFNNRHLEVLEAESLDGEGLFMKVQMNQSEIRIAMASRTVIRLDGKPLALEQKTVVEPGRTAHFFGTHLDEGQEVEVEKLVSVFTSRDTAISECGSSAQRAIARMGGFEELLAGHTLAWRHLWHRFSIDIETSRDCQNQERVLLILRLHLFHLLQTLSLHTMNMDVGVPARGWHGEAYRGHIFWDELFIFPLMNLRLPKITRALLLYRYRRLKAAVEAARIAGYRGAMYPWQSGSTGREESQQLHLNPNSGRWIRDNSHLQRHVSSAIAYNFWRYYQVTRDTEFLSFYGAEMIFEIARFWASFATRDVSQDRYDICGVMGPDEYHDAYPGAESPGLDNNAYTNLMAVWVLCRALEIMDILPDERRLELCERLGIDAEEIRLWSDVSRRMRIVFHDGGIISQFEGYGELAEFDWEAYRKKYGDIQRLDRILEAEGDSPNRYKASKQADVLMLFYLFSSEELKELFERLGYPFSYDTIPRNIDYYMQRTSHGSTLSRIVHSWVLARSDRVGSWRLFTEGLESDILDIQGGSTPEGIHLGAMAGTVDLIQRCYTGLVTHGEVLWFNPDLPDTLTKLRMHLRYRGHSLEVELTHDRMRITSSKSQEPAIQVGFRNQVHELASGTTMEFALTASTPDGSSQSPE